MSFAAPIFLWGLLAVPVVGFLYARAQRRRSRYAIRFTNLDVLAPVAAERAAWRRHAPAAVLTMALIALIVGLARPEATVLVPREEATVVLVMDVSGSMRATDVDPTRLAAAQASARSFVDQLPAEFQVGLVTFSENAHVLNQPTVDRASVAGSIDSLAADGPTAMGDGLVEALELGQTDEPDRGGSRASRSRRERLDAVVLLSDGYNTSGRTPPLDAADRAVELDVPVYTIALGTPEGTVEVPGPYGPRLVQVPPDYETLQAIAETTDAQYFTAPSTEDLERIYADLGSRIGFVEDRQEVSFAFAGAALALAALGAGLAIAWGGRLP